MMKKGLIALFLMISMGVSSAFAGGIEAERHYFDGFYLGAHGGATQGSTHFFYITDFMQGGTNPRLRLNDAFADKTVVVGGLNMGYGWVVSYDYYLGVEVFGTLGTLANSTSFFERVTPANLSRAFVTAGLEGRYGITFKPGFFARADTLLFLQLGAVWANFRSNAEIGNFAVSGAPATGYFVRALKRRMVTGWRVGFGVDHAMTPNWHVWFSYLYTNYGNVGNFGRNRQELFTNALRTLDLNVIKIRTQTNTVLLGVSYYFH